MRGRGLALHSDSLKPERVTARKNKPYISLVKRGEGSQAKKECINIVRKQTVGNRTINYSTSVGSDTQEMMQRFLWLY